MCQKRQETNPSKDFSVPVNPELFYLSRFGSEWALLSLGWGTVWKNSGKYNNSTLQASPGILYRAFEYFRQSWRYDEDQGKSEPDGRGWKWYPYVRSVLHGFLYDLEACLVNLELP